MSIDWFTFVAQIVNFLILIGLLWRFAYRPILRAMDERESSIRGRLDEAAQKQAAAEDKARKLDEQHQALDAQREERLACARAEAGERKQELLAEARAHAAQREAEWRADLERQHARLAEQLERRTAEHLVTAVRELVRELADAELEQRIIDRFIARLRELDDRERANLEDAVAAAQGELRVSTSFELGEEQQERLREQLGTLFDGQVDPQFETEDEQICGVTLRAGDQQLAWNAAAYVGALREQLEDALATAARQSGGPTAEDRSADEAQPKRERDDDEQ